MIFILIDNLIVQLNIITFQNKNLFMAKPLNENNIIILIKIKGKQIWLQVISWARYYDN